MATVPQPATAPLNPAPNEERAYQLRRMANDLIQIRFFLLRNGLYGTLPSCRAALGDAALELEKQAETLTPATEYVVNTNPPLTK